MAYSLKNWTFALAILLALSSIGACQQIIKNLEPGHVTIDLGEGYNASFDLANSEKTYDVEVKEPEFGDILLTTKSYGFIIYTAGGNEELTEITLNIYSTPKKRPVPKPSREDREFGPLGIRAITPKITDGTTGFVGIDWPKGNTSTNINDVVDAFFYYYP
ncbi:MAG: hypothetical protein MUO26_10905 [Methanotrichaceae archaeon]|nr:hypothetical protein [Methanotrichaceae archaeon]